MYRVEGNVLYFSNGAEHKFGSEIAEVLDFDRTLIVRLSLAPVHPGNENIFGFGYDGNLQWQIPVNHSRPSGSPYVGISRSTVFLEAHNWDGLSAIVHPDSGIILEQRWVMGGSDGRSRAPSPRRWI